ncbi:MAG: hypothetical protein J6D42_10815 [Clostridia bacterium]|nr:hypothetical protein [Clostridia bacterium]
MKRLIALLLAIVMGFSMFALVACDNGNEDNNEGDDNNVVEGGDDANTPSDGDETVDYDYDIYAGVAGKDYSDEAEYTLLEYIGGTTGLNWNPHAWETNDDSYVLGYITTPLYDFVINGDLSGYTIIPEAAAELPVDVTADYVGQYGIVEGETAKAWKIALNPDVKWADGTPINAETYVYSMEQLLNPLALNRRADSFYSGDFEIVNAKAYFYNGKTSYALAGSALADAIANGNCYIDMGFWGCVGALDAEGNAAPQYINITDETLYRDTAVEEGQPEDWISAKYLYETYLASGMPYEAYAADYLYVSQSLPKVTFEEVGIKALDEYTILLVTASPVAEPEFYMPYNLSSTWLVKKDLYEACQTWYDVDGNVVEAGSADAFSITNTYCTTVDKSTSYGPYDLTFYELDKQLTFTRNDSWYGYSDGKHVGQYQTDKISCQVISEHKTALQSFLNGEIDSISLDSTDLETYASSDRLLYTPESYTTKISFNTNKEKLEAIGNNAVILTIPEFREAFSLAMDRETFCAEYTAAHEPGYGLLNYMYCYNPFTGELYRDSEYAMKAIVDLYEIEYGEGKAYGDLEEAYDAITGYDPAKATELMKTAADKAVTEGLWDGASEIILDFRVYSSDEIYVQMFTFFDESLKAVCVGTPFEGKIRLQMTEDPDYYETMYSGNATIIFTTWGGAAMSPFTMLYQCYCDAADGSGNQMELGYETDKVMVELTVKGTTLETSLQNWAHWCNGDAVEVIDSKLGKFADYTYPERCEVFAALEYTYLDSFVTAPMYYRNGASLLSRKLEYATTDYLQLVAYGGLRYITYNYTDAEWATTKSGISY